MLLENQRLRALDVSWCNLGRFIDREESSERPEDELLKAQHIDPNINLNPQERKDREKKIQKKMKEIEEKKDKYNRMPPRKKIAKLDLSIATAWSTTFLMNKSLVHLDISHNNFQAEEIKVMGEGLNKNHTILGIHSSGNECTTDGLGFVNEFDTDGVLDQEDIALHQIFTRLP
jgi:hypothetical protein